MYRNWNGLAIKSPKILHSLQNNLNTTWFNFFCHLLPRFTVTRFSVGLTQGWFTLGGNRLGQSLEGIGLCIRPVLLEFWSPAIEKILNLMYEADCWEHNLDVLRRRGFRFTSHIYFEGREHCFGQGHYLLEMSNTIYKGIEVLKWLGLSRIRLQRIWGHDKVWALE